jgi:hypothetical protein
VCALHPRVPWFDSPGSPAHFVSQAGSLVTRRVLVVDATLKRPKDSLQSMIISGAPSPPAAGVTRVHDFVGSRHASSIASQVKEPLTAVNFTSLHV